MNRTTHQTATRRGHSPVEITLMVGTMLVLGAIGLFCWFPMGSGKQLSSTPTAPLSAWQKIELHLNRLDQEGNQVAEKQLASIRAFFRERQGRVKTFSEAAFSWKGKWFVLRGKVTGDDGAGFRAFLQENFDKVFTADELKAVLESAMAGYLTDLEGRENDALVQIRADLADDALFRGAAPELQTEQAFREEYARLAEDALPKVAGDLKIGVAGQVGSFVGSEIATATIGRGLAARLGSSGGFLGTAARWGVYTFAVGLVAWCVMDFVIDWILQIFGHDPAGQLASQVEQAMGRIELQLIDGDPAAVANYRQLRQQELNDPSPENQLQYRQEADRIEQSGALGLRFQMQRLQELQSRMRREALQKMVKAQGG